MKYVVFSLLGYLSGSLTFGYLIPRLLKGIDVRTLSSDGNPGTANAFLYGGVLCGILVLLADLGKGAFPVWLAARYLDPEENAVWTGDGSSGDRTCLSSDRPFWKRRKSHCRFFWCSFRALSDFLPVVLLAAVYLFFTGILVINPHSLRTGVTFLVWSVPGVHFAPFSSIRYGIMLIAFVVIRKHLPEIKRIPRGQACIAWKKG